MRVPNLALLSRDGCPPSFHAVVMLSRGKIQEYGEAADSALRKMALLDTTAIPLDLLSSTESAFLSRALRGRDATEECRWIMSLELDGGKHVLAMTGEITKW